MDVTPTIRARYRAYLQTPAWRSRRNRALKQAIYRCVRCGAKRGLQVHHRTYERLGQEWDDDLEVLCEECHEGHHIQQMYESPSRVYLKLADEVQSKHIFSSIAELSAEVKAECARLKINYDEHQIDRALEFVCGANRMAQPPPQTPDEVRAEEGRPLNHHEAKEFLRRTGMQMLIKTMPTTVSTIDIYGPVPEEDRVEHDRY